MHRAVSVLSTEAASVTGSDKQVSSSHSRFEAVLETLTRILLLPLYVATFLVELPDRVIYKEPDGYGLCKWTESYCEGTIPTPTLPTAAMRMRVPLVSSGTDTSEEQQAGGSKADAFSLLPDHAADGKIILQRFVESWKDSVMLTLQGILYYMVQHCLRLFAIDHLLFVFQRDLQRLIAWATGAMYTTAQGARIPMSLLGALLLVYEDADIVQDVVDDRWGMTFHGQQSVPAHNSRHCWVPDLVYFSCSSPDAFILTLKGADPMWQMGLAADPPTSKSPQAGRGEVHDGLWQGLHQPDPFCPSRTMYDALVGQLRLGRSLGKALYITGHSLGGSLSTVFVVALLRRDPALAACIRGIVTFASPRAGNPEFASVFDSVFGDVSLRFVNGADMVPMLPPKGLGFQHVQGLQHLASRPVNGSRVLQGGEASPAVRSEDRWGYVNCARKLLEAPMKGCNAFRLLTRIVMVWVPGFSDHLPTDYLEALQEEHSLLMRKQY
ncbi:hypothetical protein WJX73_006280 [Symbiochloris irregularis]|uniref:Fungal lipase-type domain-containing protein n=1 Tax=Symbiochloris irregularis TaxID=706552 RepID=A0AAW1NY31_9CHLO